MKQLEPELEKVLTSSKSIASAARTLGITKQSLNKRLRRRGVTNPVMLLTVLKSRTEESAS